MVDPPTDQFVVDWQFPADPADTPFDPTRMLTVPASEPTRPQPDVVLVRV